MNLGEQIPKQFSRVCDAELDVTDSPISDSSQERWKIWMRKQIDLLKLL